MVWSLALCPDDAKQDPVVYGTKFGVVFLAEGPRTASIQKVFDCFGLYHPGLERERDFQTNQKHDDWYLDIIIASFGKYFILPRYFARFFCPDVSIWKFYLHRRSG